MHLVRVTGADDGSDLIVRVGQGHRQRLSLQGAVVVAVAAAFGRVGEQLLLTEYGGQFFQECVLHRRQARQG